MWSIYIQVQTLFQGDDKVNQRRSTIGNELNTGPSFDQKSLFIYTLARDSVQ